MCIVFVARIRSSAPPASSPAAASASIRPARTASRDVSYAPINELRTQYQAAARWHLAHHDMSIARACEERGTTL